MIRPLRRLASAAAFRALIAGTAACAAPFLPRAAPNPSGQAEAQGATRLERGQTVFREAELAARQRGWPFGWRLAVVPGVGHNAHQMFTSDAAFYALRPGH
jgi:hypothetical protein